MGDTAGLAGKARSVLGLIGLAWLLLAGPVDSADECPPPATWHRDNIAVAFERERLLEGFPTPLRSTGQVQVEGGTVWWRTETPIASTIRIDEAGVWQSVGRGELTPLIGSAGGGAAIAELMATILYGDLEAAAVDFVIEQDRNPATGDWLIALVPRAAPLAALVDRIRLTGCNGLRTVTIEQMGGDVDRIAFSELDQRVR